MTEKSVWRHSKVLVFELKCTCSFWLLGHTYFPRKYMKLKRNEELHEKPCGGCCS